MDKIPDLVGYLVLTEDGAVLESGGELENDERVAAILSEFIALSNRYVVFTLLICHLLLFCCSY